MIKSIVIACLCLTVCQAAKIPSFFTKCKKSDSTNLNSCILDNIKKGYDQFVKGDNAYHLQSLSPLKVPKMYIDVNGGLTIDLTDVTISGLEDAAFTGASIDLDKKEVKLDLNIPGPFIFLAQYNINGRILILPIQGNGDMNTTFIDPNIKYSFTYEIEKHNNKEYLVPKTNILTYTVSRVYFGLENLFNGDKRLGEEMKKFLNENWKEVNEEIGMKLGEALGEVFMQVVIAFFGKIPYNELFDE